MMMAIAVGRRHQLNVWARWHGRRHAGTIPDYLNLADVRRMFVFWMGFANAKEYPGARARVCSLCVLRLFLIARLLCKEVLTCMESSSASLLAGNGGLLPHARGRNAGG